MPLANSTIARRMSSTEALFSLYSLFFTIKRFLLKELKIVIRRSSGHQASKWLLTRIHPNLDQKSSHQYPQLLKSNSFKLTCNELATVSVSSNKVDLNMR